MGRSLTITIAVPAIRMRDRLPPYFFWPWATGLDSILPPVVTMLPSTQAGRKRAAVDQAVAVGPSLLRGNIDADHMANAMVRAVRDYVEQERAAGGDGRPLDAEARALQGILSELLGCGSGYLAGHCDAACV